MIRSGLQEETKNFNITHIAATLLIVIILVVVLKQLSSLLQPLFIAIFFYFLGAPLSRILIRKKCPGVIAHLSLILLAIAVMFVFGGIIGTYVGDFVEKFPSYRTRFLGFIQPWLSTISQNYPELADRIQSDIAGRSLSYIEGIARAIVGNTFGFLTASFLVVFYLIFLINEVNTLPQRLESAFGSRRSGRILDVGQRINRGILRYMYIKVMASVLVAFLSLVVMLIFGLDNAVLWAMLVFFGNFIPYLGSAAAVLIPIIIAIIGPMSTAAVITLAVGLVLCQILVSNYLEPKYAGKKLNLSPLFVLLSLAFWGWLWGIVGLILSIPLVASLRIALENIEATKEIAIIMSNAPADSST